MKKNILFAPTMLFVMLLVTLFSNAQVDENAVDTSWKKEYRAFPTKENDLIHTKLVAGFDYTKSQLNGEVWLQLRPHFYATGTLTLDAKGMEIHQVALVVNGGNKKLEYQYDGLFLNIQLDKKYTAKENYTLYIKYTAKPNDYIANGSAAITDAKGLYFINPLGTDTTKPTQVWTQGETEGTSVWIPTIDKPNQKCTQEFHLTVPSKYVSLSNGLLVKQVDNKNGTRLDVWKMDQPHAPYLFFIGIGDYAIVKDTYKAKEVSYYIEKAYEKEARKIFGNTPAMIAFFEQKLGIPFPWVKYAQMTARDYVTGAMENTTCTLHDEKVQQNARELKDGNSWEGTIAHELFHQWFGDLVTAESWSNLTVNESFADFSETLWLEHSMGKDYGQYENLTGLSAYLSSPADAEKNLVRFYYSDREDMFDLVSYQKGGRILNMLRHYVGEDAFFASLHKYLNDNKFNSGSAIKLKLAFEAVTGKDLNWFFNQWYFDNGHPYLRIGQSYQADKKRILVTLQQTQVQNKVFEIPVGIDVYADGKKKHYEVWSKNRIDSFYFPALSAPDNVNVDNDKVLLWVKDENKPLSQYIYQYYHATNLMDRFEALDMATENIIKPEAQSLLKAALKDSFYIIRMKAIHAYNPAALNAETEAIIAQLAAKDPSTQVREKAIDAIGELSKAIYRDQFIAWTKDSSYLVAGAALDALEKIDSISAIDIATKASKTLLKKRLNTVVTNILSKYGDESNFDFIAAKYESLPIQSEEKFYMTTPFAELLIKTNDESKFKKGIDLIVALRNSIPDEYKSQTDPYFNSKVLGTILKEKKKQGAQNLVQIVIATLPRLN
jgi:aminopeptidase N